MAEKLNNKANRAISKALFAFLIFLAIIFGFRIFSPDPAAMAAKEVYFALEKYFDEHQAFPESLDQLVGSYTSRIPDGVMAYERNAENGYFFMVCMDGLLLFPVENCHTRSELQLRHGFYKSR